MTRSEALAPLKSGEGRFKGNGGALIRRMIRRAALAYNVDYYEDKGFLESDFVFKGPVENVKALIVWFEKNLND